MSTDTRNVLVVDDDLDMQLLLGLYASEAGYTVVGTVGDGQQAVDTWAENRRNGTPLHAIVLDQMMPYLTGLEAAEAIRSEDDQVLLVLISAAMTPSLAAQARDVGVCHALSKADLHDLTSALAAAA